MNCEVCDKDNSKCSRCSIGYKIENGRCISKDRNDGCIYDNDINRSEGASQIEGCRLCRTGFEPRALHGSYPSYECLVLPLGCERLSLFTFTCDKCGYGFVRKVRGSSLVCEPTREWLEIINPQITKNQNTSSSPSPDTNIDESNSNNNSSDGGRYDNQTGENIYMIILSSVVLNVVLIVIIILGSYAMRQMKREKKEIVNPGVVKRSSQLANNDSMILPNNDTEEIELKG